MHSCPQSPPGQGGAPSGARAARGGGGEPGGVKGHRARPRGGGRGTPPPPHSEGGQPGIRLVKEPAADSIHKWDGGGLRHVFRAAAWGLAFPFSPSK